MRANNQTKNPPNTRTQPNSSQQPAFLARIRNAWTRLTSSAPRTGSTGSESKTQSGERAHQNRMAGYVGYDPYLGDGPRNLYIPFIKADKSVETKK